MNNPTAITPKTVDLLGTLLTIVACILPIMAAILAGTGRFTAAWILLAVTIGLNLMLAGRHQNAPVR